MKGTVVITGANGGIGKNYCREMLALGHHVVLTTRSQASGEAAMEALRQEYPAGSMELMILDVADLASVERFCQDYLARHTRLDVLVHNAGIFFFDDVRRESSDGIELNLAVHVVGPFALTAGLLPVLVATPGSRVVSVSSTEHRGASLDLDDPQMSDGFASLGNTVAYARSKWAALAMTHELGRRLQKAGHEVHALAAHPGVSITGIQHKGNPTALHRAVIWVIGTFLAGAPEDAAKPLVMASMRGKAGEFYGPTGFREMRGAPGLVEPDPATRDAEAGEGLWRWLEGRTGLTALS